MEGRDLFAVIEARRSVRAFESRPVEPEKRQAILEAAHRAPSAGNLQAYEIVEVMGRTLRERLAAAALGQEPVAQAPLLLVFCALPERSAPKYGTRGRRLYCLQDATIACAYAQLAATALGLGSVWIGAFDGAAVRVAIGGGGDAEPVAILPIGYPAEHRGRAQRRPLDQLVRRAGLEP